MVFVNNPGKSDILSHHTADIGAYNVRWLCLGVSRASHNNKYTTTPSSE